MRNRLKQALDLARTDPDRALAMLESARPEMFKVNSAGTAAVALDVDWLHLDTAPIGCKVQLHTVNGVAVYGALTFKNRKDFLAWAPCPRRPPWLVEAMTPKR